MEHAKAIFGLLSEARSLGSHKHEEIKGQLLGQEMLAKKLVNPNKAKS